MFLSLRFRHLHETLSSLSENFIMHCRKQQTLTLSWKMDLRSSFSLFLFFFFFFLSEQGRRKPAVKSAAKAVSRLIGWNTSHYSFFLCFCYRLSFRIVYTSLSQHRFCCCLFVVVCFVLCCCCCFSSGTGRYTGGKPQSCYLVLAYKYCNISRFN